MLQRLTLILSIALFLGACQEKEDTPLPSKNVDDIIPIPMFVAKGEESFTFSSNTSFRIEKGVSNEGRVLKEWLTPLLDENAGDGHPLNYISLRLDASISDNPEAYGMIVSADSILIKGVTPAGLMRGIQTLRQLTPVKVIEGTASAWEIPAVTIMDEPQFAHRGMLLDVCRHFFEKRVVLKYIDALAYYKMNVLHFHLTEDQGWRLPVDKYPLLNEISSWRTEQDGSRYGGYYTKEDLKEIVAYAAERHITVIPEIELPGHSQAALAAYPQFSCEGGDIQVANDWGVFKEIYCAGNDSTFLFLEDVLRETMEIFPSKYIHIGGDEAPKFRWEHCDKCQRRITEEGLEDEHELQSYFIQRIERFLNENGRQLIGWDEILEGGLSPNATVQSWRGMKGGKEAAEEGHGVIMSPTSHCYLDYGLSSIDLERIYTFNPIPEDLEKVHHKHILGGECNMWTEHVPDESNLDSKVFPRMIGLSEVLWSYPEERDFEPFYQRLQSHYPILEQMGIEYGPETVPASINVSRIGDSLFIAIEKNLPDLDLEYRWMESMDSYAAYINPLPLDRSDILAVRALKNGVLYGQEITQEFADHRALSSRVVYTYDWNKWYEGNGYSHLVDGSIGSLDFRDGNWQGFWGSDIEVTIDLEEVRDIHSVETHFYQYANSWIFNPEWVQFELSEDGITWHKPDRIENPTIDLTNEKSIKEFSVELEDVQAKYIRIFANNIGKVPEGHDAAGQDAWLFMDEIIVR